MPTESRSAGPCATAAKREASPQNTGARVIHVAVGMVLRGDRILIARRPDHLHQGGLWEFPGGKVETGETVQQALARELAEEVGLRADPDGMTALTRLQFDYGDKVVLLDTWICREPEGEAAGLEGQPVQWVPVAELDDYRFPEANTTLIEQLRRKLAK